MYIFKLAVSDLDERLELNKKERVADISNFDKMLSCQKSNWGDGWEGEFMKLKWLSFYSAVKMRASANYTMHQSDI